MLFPKSDDATTILKDLDIVPSSLIENNCSLLVMKFQHGSEKVSILSYIINRHAKITHRYLSLMKIYKPPSRTTNQNVNCPLLFEHLKQKRQIEIPISNLPPVIRNNIENLQLTDYTNITMNTISKRNLGNAKYYAFATFFPEQENLVKN